MECESSFYLFSKQNIVRKTCYKLINMKVWDNIVMSLIFASSIKLAADTYFLGRDKDDPVSIISGNIDFVFNACFTLELIIKCIAIGFFMDSGSYLRESWN